MLLLLALLLLPALAAARPSFTIDYRNNTFLRNDQPHRFVSGRRETQTFLVGCRGTCFARSGSRSGMF